MTDKTEAELLALAKEFDQYALTLIYDRYNQAIYRYAYRQTGSQVLAEDCVSETFTRFLAALKRRKGPRDHIRPYLYRIAHNWLTDQFRKQRPEDGLDEKEELIGSGQTAVENGLAKRQTAREIRQHLTRLNPDQRQVIILKHLEEMSNKEVAEIMGRNVGSVKALNSRALNNLRKFIQQDRN